MKKALRINIGGVLFHIDEDAYDRLRKYLGTVERYFVSKYSGKEIIEDIELRLAELFQARLDEFKKQVLNYDDVEEAVSLMGDPEDFVEEATEEQPEPKRRQRREREPELKVRKRFFRDPENKVLGGVCGGLGAYLSVDPVILRLLFVVLLIVGNLPWLIGYIVMWIVIPKATTLSQKLQMRGERVTVANIEKSVYNEYEDVKYRYGKYRKSRAYRRTYSVFDELFQTLGRIVMVVGRVILVIIGIALAFAGMVALFTVVAALLFKSALTIPGIIHGTTVPFTEILTPFISSANFNIMLISLLIILAIPLIGLIYLGIKLIFRVKTRNYKVGIIALIIWIASISFLSIFVTIEATKYRSKVSIEQVDILDNVPGRILYLGLNEKIKREELTGMFSINDYRGFYFNPHTKLIAGSPKLKINHTTVSSPELVIEKIARGAGKFQAETNADFIKYSYSVQDSLILLDNIYTIANQKLWNFSELNITLNVPQNYSVNHGQDIRRLMSNSYSDYKVSVRRGLFWRERSVRYRYN